MTKHRIGTHEEWQAAREELLIRIHPGRTVSWRLEDEASPRRNARTVASAG
jgi:hypothetical protein